MSAGDIVLDRHGNRLLTEDGDIALSNGEGDDCCCEDSSGSSSGGSDSYYCPCELSGRYYFYHNDCTPVMGYDFDEHGLPIGDPVHYYVDVVDSYGGSTSDGSDSSGSNSEEQPLCAWGLIDTFGHPAGDLGISLEQHGDDHEGAHIIEGYLRRNGFARILSRRGAAGDCDQDLYVTPLNNPDIVISILSKSGCDMDSSADGSGSDSAPSDASSGSNSDASDPDSSDGASSDDDSSTPDSSDVDSSRGSDGDSSTDDSSDDDDSSDSDSDGGGGPGDGCTFFGCDFTGEWITHNAGTLGNARIYYDAGSGQCRYEVYAGPFTGSGVVFSSAPGHLTFNSGDQPATCDLIDFGLPDYYWTRADGGGGGSSDDSAPDGSDGSDSGDPPLDPDIYITYVGESPSGDWDGVAGPDGYVFPDYAESLPAYVTSVTTSAATYTWDADSTDPRALQKPDDLASRIASTYYASSTLTLQINLNDSTTFRDVWVYMLDYDNVRGMQHVYGIDHAGQTNADQDIDIAGKGVWVAFSIRNQATITITSTAVNVVVAGVFFGSTAPPPLP